MRNPLPTPPPPLARARVLLCVTSAVLWAACDPPPKDLNAPLLSVTPDPIYLDLPAPGSRTTEVSVTLSNPAGYDLIITSVTVTEGDDTPELSLKEAEAWVGEVVLTGGETRTLTVAWQILDALPDTGALRVVTNVGERVVPISTADPVADLLITLTPEGAPAEGGLEVSLADVPAGGWRRVELTATPLNGVPVTLERLCLTDASNACLSDAEAAPFRVCDGAGATPSACAALDDITQRPLSEPRTLSLLFEPPTGTAGRFVGRLSLKSDAASAPDLLLRVTASVCQPAPGAQGCGDGFTLTAPRLTTGAARMTGQGVTLSGHLTEGAHTSTGPQHTLTGDLSN